MQRRKKITGKDPALAQVGPEDSFKVRVDQVGLAHKESRRGRREVVPTAEADSDRRRQAGVDPVGSGLLLKAVARVGRADLVRLLVVVSARLRVAVASALRLAVVVLVEAARLPVLLPVVNDQQ